MAQNMTVRLPADFPREYIIEGIDVIEDRKLGEGAYGIVKLAKYHGLTVAVKKLLPSFFPADVNMKQLDEEAQIILESFFNECNKLSRIRHPNVVQLLGVTMDQETRLPSIVMELMHESLTQLLRRTSTLPLYVEVNICYDVAKALAYLHNGFTPPIVHRDLSSNNILINRDYRAKVTDLGVSKFEASSFFQRMVNTPAPGTMAYMPPEVRKAPADCSPAMDVFAFGVIVIQTHTHKFPSPGPEQEKGKFGMARAVPEAERRHNHIKLLNRNYPLRQMAIDCLKNSSKSRPTALDLCADFTRLQETEEYEQSRLICQIKEGEAENIRDQISTLQHELEQTRGELTLQKCENQRLDDELKLVKSQLSHLKGQEEAPISPEREAVPVSSKSGKFKTRLPWRRRKKDKSQLESSEEETATNTSGDLIGDDFEDFQDEEDEVEVNGFSVVTPYTVSAAQLEEAKQLLKGSQFAWTSHRCMMEGLQGVTLKAHTVGGRIYLCGGATATGQPNISVYYCPSRNITRWAKVADSTPQYYYASVIVNRELVLIGGINVASNLCTRQLFNYDVSSKEWLEVFPPMPTARSSAAAVTWGDYLIVLGGITGKGTFTSVVEMLHLPSQQWRTAFSLPHAMAGFSTVVYRGRLYILGGSTEEGLVKFFYSIALDTLLSSINRLTRLTTSINSVWTRHRDCPYTMMALCLFNGYLLALGGNERTASISEPAEWVWAFYPSDVEDQEWVLVQKMHTARKLCCATAISSTILAVFGGNPYYSVLDVANVTYPSLST